MKDLTFYDKNLDLNVNFRTDLLSYTDNGQDFTVMDIKGLNISTPGQINNRRLYASFQKLPYNLKAFRDFAVLYGLGLDIADTNGSNKVTLVVATDSSQS